VSDFAPPLTQRRVLSGMRPTGKLHLGNYMGALHNWVRLQHEYECFFFIANLHALTTDYADPSQIKQNTVDVALDFLAAGLDPEKCTIFVQSHVKQHAELHLLLSMMTPLSWLERVPTYKDQIENLRGRDLATYGFLGYPLLQSADILLYRPEFVPIGQDQVSHVELTREVARRFNSLYKTTIFPEPEALLTPTPKLPGTDGRKMSKSYGNTIGLSEHPARIVHKMQSMTTNGQRLQQTDPGDPDLCPVGDLHKVFSSTQRLEQILSGCRTATIPCAWCKHKAGESITAVTEPIYEKRQELERTIDQTWEMLIEQADKAASVAEETLGPVRAALNITRSLGAVRRQFGTTAAEKKKLRDVSGLYLDVSKAHLSPAQRSKELRDYWRMNILPYDIRLSQEANRNFASIKRELAEPFLTAKGKRVFIGGPNDNISTPLQGMWSFLVSTKTYEVWVLLRGGANDELLDFVLPQKIFAQPLADWKKVVRTGSSVAFPDGGAEENFWAQLFRGDDAKGEYEGIVLAQLRNEDGRFMLRIGYSAPIDVTDLSGNYDPLR
jgi:tryptophanyl-tRNA synthetase